MKRKVKVFSLANFKALGDEGAGLFEAIVAVFNNVDRAGDKIIPGAFAGTLQRWEEKGRPIPVIFSHEWDNLDAHIGEVLEAAEVEEGLYVKGQLDMEEDFARRVWKRMKRGTLAEFSFAYDVLSAEQVDGVNELRELELLEVGPTLVGMNPDTQLLDVKRGARHTSKEFAMVQEIHDLAVALGAKCAEPPEDSQGEDGDGEGAGQDEAGDSGAQSSGKARSQMLSAVARLESWLQTMEAEN